MSGARLPRLRPLGEDRGAVPAVGEESAVPEPGEEQHADGGSIGGDPIETELAAYCRSGGLVYAALVDASGRIGASVCTVGARPPNESQIGGLASQAFLCANALGREIGEPVPFGMNVLGGRWGYSLDLLCDGRLLLGIFPSQALPAIVRASAQKTKSALDGVLKAKN
ncbi:MAG: hypothetical protein ACR2RV_18895 [Verrucomicrobiales bacterium]